MLPGRLKCLMFKKYTLVLLITGKKMKYSSIKSTLIHLTEGINANEPEKHCSGNIIMI